MFLGTWESASGRRVLGRWPGRGDNPQPPLHLPLNRYARGRALYIPFPTACFCSAGFLSNMEEKSSQLAGRNTRE